MEETDPLICCKITEIDWNCWHWNITSDNMTFTVIILIMVSAEFVEIFWNSAQRMKILIWMVDTHHQFQQCHHQHVFQDHHYQHLMLSTSKSTNHWRTWWGENLNQMMEYFDLWVVLLKSRSHSEPEEPEEEPTVSTCWERNINTALSAISALCVRKYFSGKTTLAVMTAAALITTGPAQIQEIVDILIWVCLKMKISWAVLWNEIINVSKFNVCYDDENCLKINC